MNLCPSAQFPRTFHELILHYSCSFNINLDTQLRQSLSNMFFYYFFFFRQNRNTFRIIPLFGLGKVYTHPIYITIFEQRLRRKQNLAPLPFIKKSIRICRLNTGFSLVIYRPLLSSFPKHCRLSHITCKKIHKIPSLPPQITIELLLFLLKGGALGIDAFIFAEGVNLALAFLTVDAHFLGFQLKDLLDYALHLF